MPLIVTTLKSELSKIMDPKVSSFTKYPDNTTKAIENFANVINMMDKKPDQYRTVAFLSSQFHLSRISKLAEKFNLVKSGGSDYHGGKKGIKMGEANVPNSYLKNFIS